MVSCHSCVVIMAVMVVPTKRPGVDVNWGRSIVMWGELSPHKDLAISTNLGGCIGFGAAGLPRGIFIHCMKIFGVLDCLPGVMGVGAVVTGTWGNYSIPGEGVKKKPWGWALWHLLLLSLLDSRASSSATAGHQEGVIMTQGDGGSSERTFSSVNVVKGLMHLLSSLTHSANWCGFPSCGGLATLAQCCRAFAYAKVFSGCCNQNFVCKTLGSVVADGCYILCSVGWAGLCNCCTPQWHNSTPWTCGKMPLSSSQTLRCLLSGEQLLALATRSESPAD